MVKDLWYAASDDGTLQATPRHGRGCRWKAGGFAADIDAVRRADLAALAGAA
ncbi:hypothetical protein [Saccharothrix texasensis]|uniref:Uncharacterized protein n=1 Tax=Saccharothrix texasensis TaxID=103734 RepID=A0A3N1H1X2_9PSEU|nr:hypothetical protein [Saccharothrix texasensis]ROP36252.1 hypothetical protein EDD40_1516 [Saccharothrix texasensis]